MVSSANRIFFGGFASGLDTNTLIDALVAVARRPVLLAEGRRTDLAREFTNVILAQRGFQASSRVISTSDEMLQDLVSLIR